ncbi:MAG: HAMP domain-containing histidine kinase [Elusimicrobia bacterium]|nr:HAMP domain-containing histidine kinase [Elusimicrobiota bacterium]
MLDETKADRSVVSRYEAAFSVFMAAVAYLWRDNPHLVYPQILYLFILIMALNLAAGKALKLWPERAWVSALLTLADCAAIAAVVAYSGGADSNLWVLYLLPIFSASVLLGPRETAWIAAGTVLCDTLSTVVSIETWGAADYFTLTLKNGTLVFAAAATWVVSQRERRACAALREERGRLKDLEEIVAGNRERLERSERLADVGLMGSCVAHDLMNVFGVILGFVELGFKDKTLSDRSAADLESIRHSAELGRNIVDGLRGHARERTQAASECSLNDAVVCAATLAAGDFSKEGAALSLRLVEGLPGIRGDSADLKRVFLNLLVNAARAAHGGGRVSVATSVEEGPDRRSWVSAVVEDTGPGIPPEVLPRLFKPFSTGHAASGGTGLGLYLSLAIAQRLGGALTADNRPEGGARFVLRIPVACGGSAAGGAQDAAGLNRRPVEVRRP